jgi:putative hydrolase of the HAD superfamily
MVQVIGFDCDDTLWESESTFVLTQQRVRELLAHHADPDVLETRLYAVERANLDLYGYGAKAFTLSLIETALELAGDALTASDVRALLAAGKEILAHPVELLDGAREAVEAAVDSGLRVVLVTKGDLFHQESKVARSGFGDLVYAVEVIGEKDEATYARILRRHAVDPGEFVMIGNSLRSDVAPVLALGGYAAHVPHELTWELEKVEDESAFDTHPRFRAMTSLAEVRPWIDELVEVAAAG